MCVVYGIINGYGKIHFCRKKKLIYHWLIGSVPEPISLISFRTEAIYAILASAALVCFAALVWFH